MSKCNDRAIVIAAMTLAIAALADAGESPTLAKDLTSVIALLGLPCGEVVGVVHKGDNDNDGHRYHVFVNADGRVVAQKQ
jgi:hypothetical protein